MNKQKLYFITYGTKNFDTAAKHLTKLAKESNFFEECIYFKPQDLEKKFVEKYEDIFSFPRGAGYWIWKHKIIFDTLKNVNEGDLVIYSDSGSSFNSKAKKRFFEYIEMINDSRFGNFRIQCEKQYIEKDWTIKELFKYFNIGFDSEIAQSTQLEATQMIFKKNHDSMDYFKEYVEVIDHDMYLISDKFNSINQAEGFIENRHDQSIFSLLSKIRGCVSIENETNFSSDPTKQYEYPFLSVRTYGHGLKDKLKFKINYQKKYDLPVFFD